MAQQPEKIFKIDVIGNESIDRGAILNSVKTKENDTYNLDTLREDMKNIYKTGFFSDVQIDVKDSDKGKIITFVVIERPQIKMIYIEGNKEIKNGGYPGKVKNKNEYCDEHRKNKRKHG
jgi:outer membrane protein insertion porin family